MGMSIRYFFIDDKDNLVKISAAKFSRFYSESHRVCFPEYKNRRVRHAEILVELENRKPVEIVWENFSYIAFDGEGAWDREFCHQKFIVAMTGSSDGPDWANRKKRKTIIDRKIEFADKIMKNRFIWVPSPLIRQAIYRAVFG